MAGQLPPGYSLTRERVTWTRTETRGYVPRTVTSHPVWAKLTEPDGNVRYFDTVREAREFLADPDHVIAPEPIDAEVSAWNAALASGDADRIATARDVTLSAIHARIMSDDRYQARTH